MKLSELNLNQSLSLEVYKTKLKLLQEKVHRLSIRALEKDVGICIVFEGWDAAGKGGAIRRLISGIDPRLCEVHQIGAPNEYEKSRHYLWRFWRRIPEKGRIGIFDRSWYGRVLVERVEGFASKEEWSRAYKEILWFEEDLIFSGMKILKFFIHIDKETQEKRFLARQSDPLKRWKLTEEDWRNREKWNLYEEAIDEMLEKTNIPESPWFLVPGNDKYFSRIFILEKFVQYLNNKL